MENTNLSATLAWRHPEHCVFLNIHFLVILLRVVIFSGRITVPLINKLNFSRMLSSAHTWSDVQQHAKQCTSTRVSMYEHTRAYSSCTEDTHVVYTGTWVQCIACTACTSSTQVAHMQVRASLAHTRVASSTVTHTGMWPTACHIQLRHLRGTTPIFTNSFSASNGCKFRIVATQILTLRQ